MASNSLDDAIRASLLAQASETLPAVEDAIDRVWGQLEIADTVADRRRATRTRRRQLWYTAAATLACLAMAVVFGAGQLQTARGGYFPASVPLATAADYAQAARVNSAQMSLPAPLRPIPGFTAGADPLPVSVGQTVEIGSAEAWTGERVWLYWAPGSEQYLVAYLRKLPRDAMLIGVIDIAQSDGAWELSWQVPDRLERDGIVLNLKDESVGYLVAVSDEGHLAYHGLPLGPQRVITITPQPATPGDSVVISGADYPPNTKVRIDVLHDSPEGGTDLQTNLGWVMTSSVGTFDFAYALPEKWNWPFADHTGTMMDHWLTVGSAGTYHILTVEQGENGPGVAVQKSVEISRRP